jgi:16S rRNA processing protein RimM
LTEPQRLAVGRVLRPHGVRGELVLEALTDFPETLPGKTVLLRLADGAERSLEAQNVRWHRGRLLLQLDGIDNRDAADDLRGATVEIDLAQATPLGEGQYYHHQVIGLRAVTEGGEVLGQVAAILETGANDVYQIATPEGGELLLPAIGSVIKKIDLDAGEMVVHLLEGLR